jgi:hypothetical protein
MIKRNKLSVRLKVIEGGISRIKFLIKKKMGLRPREIHFRCGQF